MLGVINSMSKEKITNELSTYAWENTNKNPIREFVAEAWAEYLNNKKNDSDLCQEENKRIKAIGVRTNKGDFFADKIILATGGKSYPTTGSTGDGYDKTKKIGHTITPIKPSLVALTADERSISICQELQGLSLKNISIKLPYFI